MLITLQENVSQNGVYMSVRKKDRQTDSVWTDCVCLCVCLSVYEFEKKREWKNERKKLIGLRTPSPHTKILASVYNQLSWISFFFLIELILWHHPVASVCREHAFILLQKIYCFSSMSTLHSCRNAWWNNFNSLTIINRRGIFIGGFCSFSSKHINR